MSSHLMPVWHQEERKRIGATEKPTVLHLASSSKETLQIHTHICMYGCTAQCGFEQPSGWTAGAHSAGETISILASYVMFSATLKAPFISLQHPMHQGNVLKAEPEKSTPFPPLLSWMALSKPTGVPYGVLLPGKLSKEQSQSPGCRVLRWVHVRETKDWKSLKCTAGIHTPAMFFSEISHTFLKAVWREFCCKAV